MDLPSKLEGAGCLTRWPCHLCTLSVVQISVHNSAQEGGSEAVGRSDTTCVRGYRYFAHEHNPLILTLPDTSPRDVLWKGTEKKCMTFQLSQDDTVDAGLMLHV